MIACLTLWILALEAYATTLNTMMTFSNIYFFKNVSQAVVEHSFDSSTWETKAGRYL